MPRVIVKCRYYKGGSGKGLGGYMNYIATREGVEKLTDEQRSKPATDSQIELIEGFLKDNPSIEASTETCWRDSRRAFALLSRSAVQ